MPVKDKRFKTLCDNATEVHNRIKERIAKKERKWKLKKKTDQIPCKGYLQELMTKLTDVSSYLGRIYLDPRNESSTGDYLTFSSGLRDSLQFTFAQVDKILEGSSKTFDSSELSAFITKLHHITEEMKLLFPQGALNQNVICVKPDVEKWWQENFPRRVIIPKDDFYKAFYARHRRFQNDNEGVRETMAFTSELFVSKYQLDLFTRLFSPWEKSYNVHKALTEHPAYLKNATSSLAKEKLKHLSNKPGSFYFRISINNPGIWAIGAIQKNGTISHVLCYGLPIIDTLHTKRKDMYIYPAGRNQPCDLSNDIEQKKPVFIKPDPNGNSLNCTLCGDNLIDTQFDQCEHLCCHVCSRRVMSQARSEKGPTCPFCQHAVLSTSFISLFIDEFYSDVNSKSSAFLPASVSPQDQQFSPTVNHFPVNSKPSTPLTSPYGRRPPNKAEDRAYKLRTLASRIGKTENVLQAAISYLVSQEYDEDSVIKALMESNGERDKAAKILEGWKRQRNSNEQVFFGDDHCRNEHIEEIEPNNFAGVRSLNERPPHLYSPDLRSPDLRLPNQRSPKIMPDSVVTPPEVWVDDQSQVHNGCHLDPSTRGSYAIPKGGPQAQTNNDIPLDPSLGRDYSIPKGDQRPQEANGVQLDSTFGGGYYLPKGGNAQPTSPNIRTSQGADANSGPGYGERIGQNIPPCKTAERANKLRALMAQTGKLENVLQAAVAYLVSQGYDEDCVFDALMKANGDRDRAEALCKGQTNVPDFPATTSPRTPNPRPMNQGYGERMGQTLPPNKTAVLSNKLQALSLLTGLSENDLQTATLGLVNSGYDENTVIAALMKSSGDRVEAAKILEGSSL